MLLAVALAFFQGTFKKQPVYTTGPTEVLARTDKQASRLTILWDRIPIEDVCIARVAFWNAGQQYIDSGDFISAINIQASKPIIFLYAEQQVSRSGVGVTIPEQPLAREGVKLTQTISLGPPVGEAFEHDDGVALKIIFSGAADTRFSVQSRIKGVPQGFQELDLQSVNPATRWLAGVFLALFAVGAVMGSITMLKAIRVRGPGWWLVKDCVGLSVVILLVILFAYRFFLTPAAPAWVGIRAVKQAAAR